MGKDAIRLSASMTERGYGLDGSGRIVRSDDPSVPFRRLVESEGWTVWERDGAPRAHLMTEESLDDGSVLFFDDSSVAEQELARLAEEAARGDLLPDYASARFDALHVKPARERMGFDRQAFPVTFTRRESVTLYVVADDADSAWDKARAAIESPEGYSKVWRALDQADASDVYFDVDAFEACRVSDVLDELLEAPDAPAPDRSTGTLDR